MRGIGQYLLVATVLGCSTGPEDAGARLEGVVIRGPVTPVCFDGVPCDLPFAGEFDVERGGRRVARFQSDSEGHFEVRVAPGEYTVRWKAGGLGATGQAREVSVESPLTTVELHFDTGIR